MIKNTLEIPHYNRITVTYTFTGPTTIVSNIDGMDVSPPVTLIKDDQIEVTM